MGKGSGIDSVNMWLKDVGMQVSEEDAMKVLQAVKLHSLANKKMLSHAEFRDVARATLGRTQQAAAE
jgi:isopropylmalate/homocitrate/citramalate synthase